MKVVLEIGFTSIKIVMFVGTRGRPAQTSVKTGTTSIAVTLIAAMRLAKNVKRQYYKHRRIYTYTYIFTNTNRYLYSQIHRKRDTHKHTRPMNTNTTPSHTQHSTKQTRTHNPINTNTTNTRTRTAHTTNAHHHNKPIQPQHHHPATQRQRQRQRTATRARVLGPWHVPCLSSRSHQGNRPGKPLQTACHFERVGPVPAEGNGVVSRSR